MITCECDNEIDILENKQMEKLCRYHKLLIKFNDFLTKEQKCDGVLKLFEIDKRAFVEFVDFSYFCMKDIKN